MSRVLLASFAFACSILAACADKEPAPEDDITVSNEVRGRTDGRRARITQLAKVDAVARLYMGHDLARTDLLSLGAKNEAAVIDALTARPDFRTRYAARVADFLAADGHAALTPATIPPDRLADAFGGDATRAERFARWLVRSQAPLVADDLTARHDFKTMTYRELLDAIRVTATARGDR